MSTFSKTPPRMFISKNLRHMVSECWLTFLAMCLSACDVKRCNLMGVAAWLKNVQSLIRICSSDKSTKTNCKEWLKVKLKWRLIDFGIKQEMYLLNMKTEENRLVFLLLKVSIMPFVYGIQKERMKSGS